ncbi:uncharacterized protein METZ01_LOCUS504988, partial [marine metagenome]
MAIAAWPLAASALPPLKPNTHPQHGRTCQRHGDVVRRRHSLWVPLTPADEDTRHQRREACRDVNYDTSGEIEDAHVGEVAASATPDHV